MCPYKPSTNGAAQVSDSWSQFNLGEKTNHQKPGGYALKTNVWCFLEKPLGWGDEGVASPAKMA